MPHQIGTAALILCLLLLAGCSPPAEEIVIEGPPPIPKIVYLDSTIAVYPSVRWPELIHTELFQGFKPGMTFKEALSSLGPPSKEGKGLWGPYFEYLRPNGSVRLSFETIGSGTAGAEFSKWRLTAFPSNRSIDTIFNPILQERLGPEFRNPTEIIIMAPSGEHPSIDVTIRDNQVHSIEWLFD